MSTMTIYGGVHRGTAGRPNANPILAMMREDDWKHDPWGTAMGWGFATCEYLHHVALAPVPAEMEYVPAPYTPRGDDAFDGEDFASGVIVELALDTYTVTMAARVLSRYIGWCKLAGRDY